MRVVIKANNDDVDMEHDITFSNDQLDNDNYVDMYIDLGEDNGTWTWTMPIDELASAVEAFKEQQRLRQERDKRLS